MLRSSEKHKKPVYQLNRNLEIIKEWKSVTDACNELGYKQANIANALHKKIGAYGYLWCRVSEFANYKPKSNYLNPRGCK